MGYCAYDCVDAGTEHCPCYLALTGDCLTCSRLRGEDCCDCRWKGVCIYNELHQAGNSINTPRTDFEAEIIAGKFYMDDLVVFILRVEKGFALKATIPGSCVFVRIPGAPSFFQFPVSVIWADPDRGEIHLAIKILSIKTKSLLDAEERLVIRGIYRNGIHGVRELMARARSGRPALIITKGIGLAPGILLGRELGRNGKVDLQIDKSKICEELVADYLEKIPCRSVHYLSLADPEQRRELEGLTREVPDKKVLRDIGSYDKIAILTSDYFQKVLGKRLQRIFADAAWGYSNNAKLCCGEGICGACTEVRDGGEVLRLCKCSCSEPMW